MKIKQYAFFTGIFTLLLVLLSGCGGNDADVNGNSNNVRLIFSSTNAKHTTTAGLFRRMLDSLLPKEVIAAVSVSTDGGGNPVELTDFRFAVHEIEFEKEVNDVEVREVEFHGPYILDLLDESGPLKQTIGDTEIPADTYTGIEMEIHKAVNLGADHPLKDRSIYLAGRVDRGAGWETFEMHHDAEEEFYLNGGNPITVTEGTTGNDLIVDIKLASIFDNIDLGTANLSEAISNYSNDPVNRSLALTLKNNIKAAADFGKDEDGDSSLDETEDVD